MNLTALQATLRQFAADRNWQPFQTPKNLAMALIVEAAELAEIFQWMTAEQSQAAHGNAAIKQHIGEEVADVLLYLLQVADHCRIDLPGAVADKLVKNGRKHPPLRPAAPASLAAPTQPAAPETHVLLDFENVQPSADELRQLVPGLTDLWLFHGPHQKGLALRYASFGPHVMTVPISRSGKNALDFHLSFYVGYIAARHPDAQIVVVANDQGYGPMLTHASTLGFDVGQVGHVRTARWPAKPAAKPTAKPRAAAAKSAPAVAPAVVASPSPAPKVARRTPARQFKAGQVAAKAPAVKRATVVKPPAAAKKKAAKPTIAAASPTVHAPTSAPSRSPKAVAARSSAVKPTARSKGAAGAKPTATAALPSKLLASLRKMGEQRPLRQAGLARALQSLLGAQATAEAAQAALAALVAAGRVSVDARGRVSYTL